MKILNTIHEDYHIHTINYSDGMNTIDEIVQYADKVGLHKLVITDHSQALLDYHNMPIRNRRTHINRRKNIHNDVEVSFGVEGDLLDETGNCCFHIQNKETDFCILSCHPGVYTGDLKNITEAYINAIQKYQDKIKFIGHICKRNIAEHLDVDKIATVLNEYNIPIEINTYYLATGKTDTHKLDRLLNQLHTGIYINSDAHVLSDFDYRALGFDYAKKKGYI